MIVIEEYFSILPAWRDAFDARCRALAGMMACRKGCRRVEVARSQDGAASHLLWSVWDSFDAFRAWTRSDAFVLTASGALPRSARRGATTRAGPVFAAPKRVRVNRVLRGERGRDDAAAPRAFRLPRPGRERVHADAPD